LFLLRTIVVVSGVIVVITVFVALFLYCTFKIYSAVQLSSCMCVINSVCGYCHHSLCLSVYVLVLIGRDIEAIHCIVHHEAGQVTLLPVASATCCINNVPITQPTKLSQGLPSYLYSTEILPRWYCVFVYVVYWVASSVL